MRAGVSIKIHQLAVVAMLVLGGCASPPAATPPAATPPAAKAPAVNLMGMPPEFRAGYSDGCASVNAPRRRDEARFKADANYAQGWRDGYDICLRRR